MLLIGHEGQGEAPTGVRCLHDSSSSIVGLHGLHGGKAPTALSHGVDGSLVRDGRDRDAGHEGEEGEGGKDDGGEHCWYPEVWS